MMIVYVECPTCRRRRIRYHSLLLDDSNSIIWDDDVPSEGIEFVLRYYDDNGCKIKDD